MEQKSTQKIKKRTADYGTMTTLEQIVKEGQRAYRELHGEVCPAIGDGESFLASFAQKVVEGMREKLLESSISPQDFWSNDENRELLLRRLAQFSGGTNNQQTK